MSKASEHEPMPIGDGQVVITGVIRDLLDRDEVGTKKYGTTLKTRNGRDALIDAYQEALDLCMYLKQTIMDRNADNPINIDVSRFKDSNHPDDVEVIDCGDCSCSECDRDYIADIRRSAVHG